MSTETELDKAKTEVFRWRLAIVIWACVHIAVTLLAPISVSYLIEPGWLLAVYFGYRIGRATQVGGGE